MLLHKNSYIKPLKIKQINGLFKHFSFTAYHIFHSMRHSLKPLKHNSALYDPEYLGYGLILVVFTDVKVIFFMYIENCLFFLRIPNAFRCYCDYTNVANV